MKEKERALESCISIQNCSSARIWEVHHPDTLAVGLNVGLIEIAHS
jgi:hypothetical protein